MQRPSGPLLFLQWGRTKDDMELSLAAAASSGIAYRVGAAVAAGPSYVPPNTTLDAMYEEYRQQRGSAALTPSLRA